MTEEIRLKQEALTIAGEILDDVRPLRQEI
jgi:hypothetical protein